jgi:hypothetical protein
MHKVEVCVFNVSGMINVMHCRVLDSGYAYAGSQKLFISGLQAGHFAALCMAQSKVPASGQGNPSPGVIK